MHIWGITGGIATGKSVVTAMLAEMGALTISADAIAHDLLQPGAAVTQAVLEAFPACADAQNPFAVDRRALGRLVFADAEAKARLEALTHPPIIRALQAAADTWRGQPGRCAALEIPLLFEAGLQALVDSVVVVACRPETQAARVRARLGVDAAEAQARIDSQWPLAGKTARADMVISTNGTLDDTRRQVERLWEDCSA